MSIIDPLRNLLQSFVELVSKPSQDVVVEAVRRMVTRLCKYSVHALDNLTCLESVRCHSFGVQSVLIRLRVINTGCKIVGRRRALRSNHLEARQESVFGWSVSHTPSQLVIKSSSCAVNVFSAILDDVFEALPLGCIEALKKRGEALHPVAEDDRVSSEVPAKSRCVHLLGEPCVRLGGLGFAQGPSQNKNPVVAIPGSQHM